MPKHQTRKGALLRVVDEPKSAPRAKKETTKKWVPKNPIAKPGKPSPERPTKTLSQVLDGTKAPKESKAVKSVIARVETADRDCPAEILGKHYANALVDPFRAPPAVLPDDSLLRTFVTKVPGVYSPLNLTDGSGNFLTRVRFYPTTPLNGVQWANAFVAGLPTGYVNTNDPSYAFLSTNVRDARCVSSGVRFRNGTPAQTRCGQWVAIRIDAASAGALDVMSFAALCSLGQAVCGDFADQESFMYRWIPSAVTDTSYRPISGGGFSTDTIIYVAIQAATNVQQIFFDTATCSESHALPANESCLPVSSSIGDPSIAARYLALAADSGVFNDTYDLLRGESSPVWPGGMQAGVNTKPREFNGKALRAPASPPRSTAKPVQSGCVLGVPVGSSPTLVLDAAYHKLLKTAALPGGWKDVGLDVLDAIFPAAGKVAHLADAALGFGSSISLGLHADRLVALASSITPAAVVEVCRLANLGLLPESFSMAVLTIASLQLSLTSDGARWLENGRGVVVKSQFTTLDPWGGASGGRLVRVDPDHCSVCPIDMDCWHSEHKVPTTPRPVTAGRPSALAPLRIAPRCLASTGVACPCSACSSAWENLSTTTR